MEFHKKIKFYGTCTASRITLTASTFYSEWFSLPQNGSERNSKSLLLFLFHGTEFQVVFSSVEEFWMNSESLLLFLFHGTEFRVVFSSVEEFGMKFREFASILVLRNGIPSCFLFRGRVRNGIPRVCFYFCSMERNSELFSFLRKGSERNSESFLFRGTAEVPPEITICSVYPVFRGIIFCRKFPTLLVWLSLIYQLTQAGFGSEKSPSFFWKLFSFSWTNTCTMTGYHSIL